MADAEDLKSSGDFSSCGFDSHPGHQSFLLKMNELLARRLVCTLVYQPRGFLALATSPEDSSTTA